LRLAEEELAEGVEHIVVAVVVVAGLANPFAPRGLVAKVAWPALAPMIERLIEKTRFSSGGQGEVSEISLSNPDR